MEFRLTVGEFNDAPVASTLADKTVVEDTPSTYKFDAFTDEETSTLTYSYTVVRVVSGVKTAVSGPEIEWIEFDDNPLDDLGNVNPTFRTFTFTPSDSSHAGKYEVTVKGEDAGIGGDDSSKKSVSEKFVLTVLEFNDAPVASALKDHLLTDAVVEDTEITYKFDAFEDEETSPLAYSYTVVRVEDDGSETDVSPLWIDFVATTRTFTFKPDKSWHAGTYEVTVKGEDAGIPGKPKKSISAEFELEVKAVNDRPVAPFSEEVRKGVEEGGTMTYRVPAFTDEENDRAGAPLAYSYTVVRVAPNGDDSGVCFGGQWVEFDDKPQRRPRQPQSDFSEFTFTPSESRHKGEYRVRVFAQDTSGLETSVQFMLTVGEFNDKPVASSLVGRTVVEDTPSTYVFDAFTDEETSALTYTAFWAAEGTDSTAGEKVFVDLPDDGWIAFGAVDGDATKMQFAFKPHKSWHTGKHTLRVVGTDAGIGGDPDTKKSDFAEFVLEVVDFNDAPVASSLAAHTVQEDVDEAHASVTYPVGAFTDEETSALTYSYTIVRVEKNGDETAVSVSDWVDFDDDASSPTFTFTPHRSWHAGKYKVRVKGEDAGIGGDPDTKKSAIAEFMLTVGEFNDAPVASSLVGRTVAEDVVWRTPHPSMCSMRSRTRRRTRLLAVFRTRLFGRRGIRLGGIS